jgi:predicted nucleic acid-binding protein
MKARVFLDTNVLIYAVAGKTNHPAKHDIARHIVDTMNFEISPLILGEFYATVRKAEYELMTTAKANTWMNEWQEHCGISVDAGLINAASFIRERFKIQFWDAAHVACAERLGVDILYSEDMNHKQKYGSVTVINPFRGD